MNNDTLVLILAAGKGSRLSSISSLPKPLFLIKDYPLISFTIQNIIDSNLVDNTYIVGRGATISLNNYLKNNDNNIFKDEINYKGTIDTIIKNINIIKESNADKVLILYCDQIYSYNYNELINNFNGSLTLLFKDFIKENCDDYGKLILNDNKVISLIEKGSKEISSKCSLGIFLFDKELLLKTINNKFYDLSFDYIPYLLNKYEVKAIEYKGYFKDVGEVSSYQQVLKETDKFKFPKYYKED